MANKRTHRRAKGEGSIFKRKDGIWAAKIPIGNNSDGSIKYRTVYGKTQAEVKLKVDEIKGDVRSNVYAEPNKIIVSQLLDTWLNVSIKESVKNTTWLSYEVMIRKHINPAIGGIKLMQLTTSHLQKLYNEKMKGGRADGKEGGLSPRTVRYIHQVIFGALEHAKETKPPLITVNVADTKALKLPADPKKEMKVLEVENVYKFLETAKSNRFYKRYYPAYLLELYTGVRRGELLGIRWKDVDLKTGNIHVVQQLVKVGSKHEIRELKTESSQNRTISVPEEIVEALKEHKKAQEEYLQELGFNDLQIKEHFKTGLVFINEIGTGFIQPRNFIRNFKGCMKAAKLPEIRWHDMRHTFALLSLQQGVDIKTLQSDLGHNSIETTLDRYGHVNEEMKRDAANKRSGLLKKIIDKV